MDIGTLYNGHAGQTGKEISQIATKSLSSFIETGYDDHLFFILCFIRSAAQKPAVNEKASTTINPNEFVYPL